MSGWIIFYIFIKCYILFFSLGKDFEIEKGLVLNLRNSQDVQNAIHDIQENQEKTLYPSEQDEEKIIERIDFTLAKERDAKQILIILRDGVPFLNKLVDKIKKKEEVKIYGFTAVCIMVRRLVSITF